jgi:phosphoserine phosphatase
LHTDAAGLTPRRTAPGTIAPNDPTSLAPFRFAAFDLDGTLLDSNDRELDGIRLGLSRLRRAGLTLTLVTGRSLARLSYIRLSEALLSLLDEWILLSDGDAKANIRRRAFVQVRSIPYDIPVQLTAAGISDLVIEAGGQHIATSPRAATAFAMAYRIPRKLVKIEPRAMPEAAIGRIVAFGAHDEIRASLGGTAAVNVRRMSAFAATLVHPHSTCKSTALSQHLRNEFGEHSLDHVISFGDGANDAQLLRRSRIGVAVRHSDESAVAAADLHLSVSLGQFLQELDPSTLLVNTGQPSANRSIDEKGQADDV